MVASCTVSEIKRDIGQNHNFFPALNAPIRLSPQYFVSRKQNRQSTRRWKSLRMFTHFDTIHECGGRHTDRDCSMASAMLRCVTQQKWYKMWPVVKGDGNNFSRVKCHTAPQKKMQAEEKVIRVAIQFRKNKIPGMSSSSSFVACNSRLRSAIRRHHPQQRAVLSQICCFGERKMVLFQILCTSL